MVTNTYPYAYKLPDWANIQVAVLMSAAGRQTTSYYKSGVYCSYQALASTGRLLADTGEKRLYELLSKPVDMSSCSGDPVTRVRLLATMYVWGKPVRNAFASIPYSYVEKHRKVRVVNVLALRTTALRVVARAFL
jgi:hypothetical protein